jgi:protein-tyrosine phosphatase
MKTTLEQEFGRYFFDTTCDKGSGFMGFAGFSFLNRGTSRNTVSSIIDNRVYLTAMPKKAHFQELANTHEENAVLVVSCSDIRELAKSGADLLLEPSGKKIKYFVLAMADVSAEVGSTDQVYDALELMSQFSDQSKPILIHCREGVGRSAMMTALHLAHRYLRGDQAVYWFSQ